MRYCKRKQGNVSDHQCKPRFHKECAQARQVITANIPRRKSMARNQRTGYCHYATEYIACDHGYCREKQGENLSKVISGLYNADGHKLGKNPKSTRPPIGRMSDGKPNPAFRTNRMTKKGTIDKRTNWKLYPTWNAYMEAGK